MANDEIVARIVVEDSVTSSMGGGKSFNSGGREAMKNQKDISRHLGSISRFFMGGEMTMITQSLSGLTKALGPKGMLYTALVGAGIIGAKKLGDSTLGNTVEGALDSVRSDEEEEAREKLKEEIEDGTRTQETSNAVLEDTIQNTKDASSAFGDIGESIKEGDIPGAFKALGAFGTEIWNVVTGLQLFNKALNETVEATGRSNDYRGQTETRVAFSDGKAIELNPSNPFAALGVDMSGNTQSIDNNLQSVMNPSSMFTSNISSGTTGTSNKFTQ